MTNKLEQVLIKYAYEMVLTRIEDGVRIYQKFSYIADGYIHISKFSHPSKQVAKTFRLLVESKHIEDFKCWQIEYLDSETGKIVRINLDDSSEPEHNDPMTKDLIKDLETILQSNMPRALLDPVIAKAISALKRAEQLAEDVEGMRTLVVITSNQSQERLQMKQFFNRKIDEALKKYNKSL